MPCTVHKSPARHLLVLLCQCHWKSQRGHSSSEPCSPEAEDEIVPSGWLHRPVWCSTDKGSVSAAMDALGERGEKA